MGKHKQWEMDLEKRLQESGIFKNATQANMQEKIEEFLNSETPEQAKQDLEYFNKIRKRAEDEQLKREIEQYFTEKEIDLLEELTNTNILNLIDYNNLNYCLLQFDLISIEKYIRTEEIRKYVLENYTEEHLEALKKAVRLIIEL